MADIILGTNSISIDDPFKESVQVANFDGPPTLSQVGEIAATHMLQISSTELSFLEFVWTAIPNPANPPDNPFLLPPITVASGGRHVLSVRDELRKLRAEVDELKAKLNG